MYRKQKLPKNIGIETNRVSRGINPNKYDKHNYYDMVNNCTHLTVKEKSDLTNLFKEFQDLFSGKFGKVPGPPVKLKLKKDVKPFCAAAYTVPQPYIEIAKKEIDELVDLDVLTQGVDTAWKFPSFFRKKKIVEYDSFLISEN